MFNGIGVVEMVVIGIVAVLLFGQKLPEVARNVGRGYRELRRNLTELKSSINLDDEPAPKRFGSSSNKSPTFESSLDLSDDIDEPTAPKLAPPTPVED